MRLASFDFCTFVRNAFVFYLMVLSFGVRCIFLKRVVTFEYELNSHNHIFHEMLVQEVFSSEINEIIV
jgi:hypothetical protein